MSWFTEDDKIRKGDWPIWDYMFKYFPLAWLEEVRVAVIGNKQHNAGEPLHWAREKSKDQLNTALRHQFDYAKAKADGATVPRDLKGSAVLAQAIWRLKAQLQLDLEAEAKNETAAARIEQVHRDIADQTGWGSDDGVIEPPNWNAFRAADPDGNIESLCACGHRAFKTKHGDLPPTVIEDGKTHSPFRCV